MSQSKQASINQHHNHHSHHHEHGHDHHHHDLHDYDHHHHDGDDYQNEFDLYPEEFLKVMEDTSGVGTILDIREEWEREQIHITGSLSINMPKLIGSTHHLDPNKTYYILCSQGIRSSFAARYLLSRGFNSIYNVQSGIFGIYEYANGKNIKLDWLQVAPGFDLKLQ